MKKIRKSKSKNRITPVLAVLIVVATIYALILPATTMMRTESVYCGIEEHKHSLSCYQQIITEDIQVVVCEYKDDAEHVHSDACYAVTSVAVDFNELRCQLVEDENHQHSDICYGLWEIVCGYKGHTHSLACHSNPEADVETPDDYKQSVSNVELIGLWRDDILSVAQTQLGYTESKLNYAVDVDGETKKGYTRYGEWYGDKYGDWTGTFVSFCLNYAKVENTVISYEADHERRISQLKKNNLYHLANSEYKPREGDLIFFDLDKYTQGEEDKRVADRVGFVYELVCDEKKNIIGIKVIEGDFENRVAITEYNIIDDSIIGYGEIPERDIKVSLCDCECGESELLNHEVNCARRRFAEKLGAIKSASAISKLWKYLPEDVQIAIDVYLEGTDEEKQNDLAVLVDNLPQVSEKVASVDGVDFSLTGPFVSSMEANVSDIEESKLDGLKEYLKDTESHLLSGAYDISVIDGESKAYFDEPIKVMISGLDIGKIDVKNLRVKVYHLVGVDEDGVSEVNQSTEVEMMYAAFDEEGNLCFETEDFSVFYFTVDFHYDDLTYVIEGNSATTLSTLFTSLEIPFNSADVTNVEFSTPKYLSTNAIYNEANEIIDWELSSLAPFTTKETLTISFKDGSTLTIDVTDSQVPEYVSQGTTTVNVTISNAKSGDEVVVTLFKNGVSTGQTVTLNSSNSWKHSFNNLDPATYTVEYAVPLGYISVLNEGGAEVINGFKKVDDFEIGKTYVLVHDSNRPVQNSSGTSLSRGSSLTIKNGVITSTVSNAMQWYYDGGLKNVNTSNYLQLTNSNAANTSSTVMNQTSYTNGYISQNISGTVRYLRHYYSNTYRSTTSSSADSFEIYENTLETNINYDILIENMGYNPDENANDFEHNKEIDYLNDGTTNPDTNLSGEDYYRIYLDMTGKQEPMDLLIVVDGSGSMTVNADMNNGMRRDDAVTEFLNGKTNAVTADGFISYFLSLNSENMISVVQFYGGVSDVTIGNSPPLSSGKVDYTHDSHVLLDWTGTAKFVDCTGREANGTNYEAGLQRGTEVLASTAVRGNGHRKIVLFMSDGVPTFFQVNINDIGVEVEGNYTIKATDVGKRYAHGYSSEFEECKNTSKTAFDDFMAANPGVTVFTVGVSEDISAENTDASQHPEVLQYMASAGGGEFYSVEHVMADLNVHLENIFYPQGVIIKDELSKYVRYYQDDPDVIVTMTHKDTNIATVLYKNGALTNEGMGKLKSVAYVAGDTSDMPTSSTGSVIATFEPEYKFSPAYTYEVSFNVKTTETAYKEYIENGYNSVGDDKTDYGTNDTSSLNPGFYSNDKATAIYIISGHEKQSEYLHPVVQVEKDTIGVKKEWEDSLETDSHAAIQVQLMLNYTVDGVMTKTPVGDPVTLSANNSWMHTFYDLAKYHIVDPDYKYTVEEVSVPEGYDVQYSYVNENGEVICIITNSMNGSLEVQKVDSLGNVIPIAGITFEVYADEALTDLVGAFVTDADGKLTIEGLSDGKDYWIVETVAPPGYILMEGAQLIRLTPNGADSEALVNNKYLSVDEDGVLLIKNYAGYKLPDTGSAGEALMYAFGVLLIISAIIGVYVLKIKNRRTV